MSPPAGATAGPPGRIPRVDPPGTGALAVAPDQDSAPYWSALAEGRLVLPRCVGCGRRWFPPSPRCPHCGGAQHTWTEATGTGRLYSWVVVRHPFDEEFAADVPYTVAVVTLDDADGARLLGRLLDPPDGSPVPQPRADLPVRLVTYDADGQVLPAFVPC